MEISNFHFFWNHKISFHINWKVTYSVTQIVTKFFTTLVIIKIWLSFRFDFRFDLTFVKQIDYSLKARVYANFKNIQYSFLAKNGQKKRRFSPYLCPYLQKTDKVSHQQRIKVSIVKRTKVSHPERVKVSH